MKSKVVIIFFIFVTISVGFSKATIDIYGELESIFDSTYKRAYSYNDFGKYSWGMNNYASLRLKSNINEFLTFGLAFNINTFSGNFTDQYKLYYTQNALSMLVNPVNYKLVSNSYFSIPFYYKSSYVGSLDLERLYFIVRTKVMDIETGLIRLAKGYGFFFKPMDIFNPVDPFNPQARPEGRIALKTTFFPLAMWSIDLFAIAPDNPIEQEGWGFKFGTSTNFNVDRFNFEFLYTLFLPEIQYQKNPVDLGVPEYINNDFAHLFGFSMKADVEVGLIAEITYKLEHRAVRNKSYYGKESYLYRGLDATFGLDYTIPVSNTDSKFYMMVEYMFFGSAMLDYDDKLDYLYTSKEWSSNYPYDRINLTKTDIKLNNFLRHNYICGLLKYTVNSYVSISASYLFGIDDQSSLLIGEINIEPFQAFAINISAFYPFDWQLVNHNWQPGEFGSTNAGYYQKYRISAKVKF